MWEQIYFPSERTAISNKGVSLVCKTYKQGSIEDQNKRERRNNRKAKLRTYIPIYISLFLAGQCLSYINLQVNTGCRKDSYAKPVGAEKDEIHRR